MTYQPPTGTQLIGSSDPFGYARASEAYDALDDMTGRKR